MFKIAVILAAGKGERMLPLTNYVPKPLIKTSRKCRLIHLAGQSLPVIDKYITYHYMSKMMLSELHLNHEFQQKYYDKIPKYLDFAGFINTRGNGNSWFLRNSIIGRITEPVIIIPCDIEFTIDWEQLYDEFMKKDSISMLVPVKRGMAEGDSFRSFEGKLTQVYRDDNELYMDDDLILSGIQILKPAYMPNTDSFNTLWAEQIKTRRLDVSETQPTKWIARDRIEDL